MQSLISVIIVNYHCASLTQRAVESVLRMAADAEVLVVDNSECVQEARYLRDHLPPSVTLLINPVNSGFGRACNLAYHQCRGDMILLLNPDAYLLPGALDHLKHSLRSQPNAGAVAPKVYWDAEKHFLLPPSLFPSPWQMFRNELWRLHPLLGKINSLAFRRHAISIWQSRQLRASTSLSGEAVLLSRAAIERCGGLFDERFFMYFEDSDLMLRLKRAGYCLYVVPTAECVHSYTHSAAKIGLMTESANQYFDKNFSRSRLLCWSRWLGAMEAVIPREDRTDLGVLHAPPTFIVPPALHGGWLMELSPSPFFIPAIGHFGVGSTAEIPLECWRLLHPGQYYCRIGLAETNPGYMPSWQWEIVTAHNG